MRQTHQVSGYSLGGSIVIFCYKANSVVEHCLDCLCICLRLCSIVLWDPVLDGGVTSAVRLIALMSAELSTEQDCNNECSIILQETLCTF